MLFFCSDFLYVCSDIIYLKSILYEYKRANRLENKRN